MNSKPWETRRFRLLPWVGMQASTSPVQALQASKCPHTPGVILQD